MDRRLAALLQEKFGERLLTPVRQRYDESEIRVALADATDTLRVLHDDPALRFSTVKVPAGLQHPLPMSPP